MQCFARFCSNVSNAESESRGITFHRFPNGRRDCKSWLQALSRQNSKVPRGALVCSQHFLAEDFCDTRRGPKQLRPRVVPFVITDDAGALDAEHDGVDTDRHEDLDQKSTDMCTHTQLDVSNPVPDTVNILTDIEDSVGEEKSTKINQEVEDQSKELRSYDVLHARDLIKQEIFNDDDQALPPSVKIESTSLNDPTIDDSYSKEMTESLKSIGNDNAIDSDSSSVHRGMELKTLLIPLKRCDDETGWTMTQSGGTTNQNGEINKRHPSSKRIIGEKKSAKKQNTPFICDTCNRHCTTKRGFIYHLMIHSGEKPFACDLCEYKCIQREGIKLHMTTHTGEKSFSCHFCPKKFSCKPNLTSHLKTHTGVQPYSCDMCEYKCIHKRSLIPHMAKHTGVKLFTCLTCAKTFAQKSTLVSHIATHTGEKPYLCDRCPFKTGSISSFNAHKKRHARGSHIYTCSICKWSFTRNSVLNKHMRTHTGEKPYSCAHCNHKTARKCSLIEHLRVHTKERPYTCKICTKKFTTSGSLQLHMRTHSGERKFQCNVCHSYYKRKSYLKIHMRSHTGDRPYACDYCDFKTSCTSHLNLHIRTHIGGVPYCIVCHNKFISNAALKRHQRIHTGEKPYVCSLCDSKFGRKDELKNHMKTHTGNKNVFSSKEHTGNKNVFSSKEKLLYQKEF